MPEGVYSQMQDPFSSDNRLKYEGLKKHFSASLMATEVCMNRCLPAENEMNSVLTAGETTCMRECTMKFFDAGLLLSNESANYVHSINM